MKAGVLFGCWKCSCKAPAATWPPEACNECMTFSFYGECECNPNEAVGLLSFWAADVDSWERHGEALSLRRGYWTLHDLQLAKQQTNRRRDMG